MQIRIAAWLIFGAACAFGQSGPTLAGAGYGFGPAYPIVAPGQVVLLQVAGLKTVLSPGFQQAASVPLPATLAGISVTVTQTVRLSIMGTPVVTSYKAPILSLNQMNLCLTGTSPDCFITYIAVQMPYELETNPTSPPIIQSQVVISEGGADSQAFLLGVQYDHLHVITSCENQPWQTGCPSIVAHADATLVSARSPAAPGETVVVYAWGLGNTMPAVKAGAATTLPAPVVVNAPGSQGPRVGFDFTPNAAASGYFPTASFAKAWLTPGFVGLYQVNVQLPSTFPSVPSCGQGGVQSNLTINLGGFYSFDGAAICVQAAQ
jgi:uncharacterized protein (TIGR03437 family)